MYLLALFLGYGIAYPVITIWFQYFFLGHVSETRFSWMHTFLIFLTLLFVLISVDFIPDPEFANRFQHAIGGGYIMTMVTYYASRASGVQIRAFQFFCLSLMIASCAGIVNELLESIMQLGGGYMFAGTIEDTWLDLWSNTLGALVGSLFFTYLLCNKK